MKIMNCLSCGLEDLDCREINNDNIQIVEIRLDLGYSEEKIRQVKPFITKLRNRGIEVVATCRRKDNGGGFEASEEDRINLLKSVIDMGATAVDLEFGSKAQTLMEYAQKKCKVILSYHSFHDFPDNINAIVEKMSDQPAWIYKVACHIDRYFQNLRILELNKYFNDRGLMSTCFGMGEKSYYSRAFLSTYGGKVLFFGLKDKKTAPGQFCIDDIDNYRLNSINENTSCYGIIGNPVSHSYSPFIHNKLFEIYIIDSVFLPFYVDNLPDFMDFAEMAHINGLAVTYPCKSSKLHIERCKIDDSVMRFDSGNTIYKRNDEYFLTDTDYKGFSSFFQTNIECKEGGAVILGTGNTAVKIADYLEGIGLKVVMISRESQNREKTIGNRFEICGYDKLHSLNFKLLINTVPGGSVTTKEWEELFAGVDIRKDSVIIDVNYGSNALSFLSCSVFSLNNKFDGLLMLIEQAALQFKIWTDIQIDLDVKKIVTNHIEDMYDVTFK